MKGWSGRLIYVKSEKRLLLASVEIEALFDNKIYSVWLVMTRRLMPERWLDGGYICLPENGADMETLRSLLIQTLLDKMWLQGWCLVRWIKTKTSFSLPQLRLRPLLTKSIVWLDVSERWQDDETDTEQKSWRRQAWESVSADVETPIDLVRDPVCSWGYSGGR